VRSSSTYDKHLYKHTTQMSDVNGPSLPPIDMMDEVNHQSKPASRQSPTPSVSSAGKKSDAGSTATKDYTPTTTRSTKAAAQAAESASFAAVVEAACCHRSLIPGLAESLETSSSLGIIPSRGASAKNNSSGDEGDNMEDAGHPILPSINTVSKTASRLINEFNLPPFVAMSTKDSAPQLKLEDPPLMTTDNVEGGNTSPTNLNIRRRLVVKGAIRGYRMSRATHGVSSGTYYYEAIIGGGDNNIQSGKKRPLHESSNQEEANKESDLATKRQKTGHVRIGWSTRSGDLQAPVGYDASSYAIRDTGGSRIHKSRREDKWGGKEFGPGDVVGFAICLSGDNNTKSSATVPSSLGVGSSTVGGSNEGNSSNGMTSDTGIGNHIRFFINGKQIGDKAFDNITPGTYYPAVSCYSDSSVHLNFGPHFVHPPKEKMQPVSDLCLIPPRPEDTLVSVLSTSNEGKKPFSSKKVDERVVNAFKDLVKKESSIRHEAYLWHIEMQKKEIAKLRKERGLPTDELESMSSL
jgi:Set1/Ash2 histone methyltransferase complex subunit ASH2